MPPTFTYPGVYIEEIPSGVHTIVGVATSIGAFVGWAPQGPVEEATLVQSWADYQRLFGGLDSRSYLGYAVNQFFTNGGQQAYIVRIVWDGTLAPAPGTFPIPTSTSRAVGVGLATTAISATSGSISGATNLAIGAPVLQTIALSPGSLPFLQSGQTLQFTAKGTYSDGSSKDVTSFVTWTSGSPTVATVSAGGVVTAAGPGKAVISATLNSVTTNVTVSVTAATLTAIAVTPAAPSIAAGQTQQFTATGTYSDGTSQDLTNTAPWASATPAAATVDTVTGLATAVAAGSSVISAKIGAVSGSTTLTVTAKAIVSIAVTPPSPPWIQPGQTQQYQATATFTDGSTADISATATWSTANPLVATVNATGLAKGVAVGSTQVIATSGAIAGSAKLRVTTATLSSIAVTPAAPSLAAGVTVQLTATGTFSDGAKQGLTGSAAWSSATPAAATVDPATGLVTAVAAGSSVITAKVGAITGNVTVTVTPAVLSKIVVTPANPSIAGGATQQFTATGTLTDGTTQDLTATATWKSSNPAVATISPTGLASAVASGGVLTLFAANPGQWGNSLQVTVQSGSPGRFGLQVINAGQVVESYVNLSVTPTDPQYAVTVIDNDSSYMTFIDPATNLPVVPGSVPSATTSPVAFSGGADGTALVPASDGNFELAMTFNPAAGVFLLDRVDIFNLLCVPGETDAVTIQKLQLFCALKRAFYIVDPPETATASGLNTTGPVGSTPGSITGTNSINSAYYFPWVQAPDPLVGNRPALYPPCGFVAGIYAATDSSFGVWKAPAGINASLTGASGLQYTLTDLENGNLNIQAINCLRQFRVYGDVVWGARTLQGNDQAGSEWKYIPIRRLALFLESSLYNGTQWVVFQPNDAALWSDIRLNVGAFLQGLFQQGAFAGTTPQQAYFVKCDADNNPPASIALGVVNILVGFAPLFPAEFVVIQIQQMAGQAQA